MTVLYADTSALARAYFVDEPGHDRLRSMLLEGDDPVITSELARLEFTSAIQAAARAGRLRRPAVPLARFDADCQADGPLSLVALEAGAVLREATRLLRAHPLRTLDALHLAVALAELPALAAGDDTAFVTTDAAQGDAAIGEGLILGT